MAADDITVVGTDKSTENNTTSSTIQWLDLGGGVNPQLGDLAVVFYERNSASTDAATTPATAGLTLVDSQTDGNSLLRCYKRVCTGSETGSITGQTTAGARKGLFGVLLRGALDVHVLTKGADAGTDANHTPPAATPTLPGCGALVAMGEHSGSAVSATPPPGYTEIVEMSIAGSAASFGYLAYKGSAGLLDKLTANVAETPGNIVSNASGSDVAYMTVLVSPAVTARTVTPATETDGAIALGRKKSRTAVVAAETDTGVALSRVKRRTLTPATETDTAVVLAGGITGPTVISRTLTPATETETVPTLGRVKKKTLAVAAETDTAQALTRVKRRTTTPAAETDTAVVVTRRKSRGLQVATETEAAALLNRTKHRTVAPAPATDQALPVSRRKILVLSPALETDLAVALLRDIDALPQPILEWNGTEWVPTADDWTPTGVASSPADGGPVLVWTGSHWIPDPESAWLPS